MPQKGLYKKLTDLLLDDNISQQRARENRFYENVNSEKVCAKPKSKAKPNPHADHKHEYAPVVIWHKSSWLNKICGNVGERCKICGKKKQSYAFFRRSNAPHKYYGDLEHFFEENGQLTLIDKNTYCETIFICGSQTVNELTAEVRNKLVDYMNLGHNFVIGDCKGADLTIQKFLAENGYRNVIVYYCGARARINVGGWKEKKIDANKFHKGCLYKTIDEQMTVDADEVFIIQEDKTAKLVDARYASNRH